MALAPDSGPAAGSVGGRAAASGAGGQQAACDQAGALPVFQNPNSGQPWGSGDPANPPELLFVPASLRISASLVPDLVFHITGNCETSKAGGVC